MTKRTELKTRMMEMLANNTLPETFTMQDLRKNWKQNWHRKTSVYRIMGNTNALFYESFCDVVYKMRKDRMLRRISHATYQVTKVGRKALNNMAM